jgi:hypothetical protein
MSDFFTHQLPPTLLTVSSARFNFDIHCFLLKRVNQNVRKREVNEYITNRQSLVYN